ncbi:MAG: Rab family GTPase [Promethearchaeota archaeon]
MYDLIYKVFIFGDQGTGKTSLRKRFMHNEFLANYRKTIGVDFETKILELDGKKIKLLLWDFAGEEKYRFMFPQYLYGAMGGIALYDITDSTSFFHISDWISIIKRMKQKFPIILLGSKSDLDDLRQISYEEGIKAAKSIGLNAFIEGSSKTGENIKEVFEGLAQIMINGIKSKVVEYSQTKAIMT